MAGLSRLDYASDDDAAPALRLLLADANAGAGDRLGCQCGADRLSHQERRGRRNCRSRAEALSVRESTMRNIILVAAAILIAGVTGSSAQQKPVVDAAKVDADIAKAFSAAPAEWKPRLEQDESMKECSIHENSPPKAMAEGIQKREKAKIEYPADGKLMGDWQSGEKLAQSGYGLRFTDYPARNPNGG